MAFSVTSEIQNGIAKLTLVGSLDASSAPTLQAEIQKAVNEHVKRLVLLTQDLSYIASAGLRMLLFAKQKLGSQADIYFIAPQEMVLHTLELSGFDQAVIVRETYDPNEVESVS